MRYLNLGLALVVAACGTDSGPNTQQTGKDEIVVRYGQTVVVPGTILEIGFHDLVGDSRCPSDVVCVWQGEGQIRLGLTFGDGPTVPVEVIEGGMVTHGGYSIALIELDPYPISTRPHVPADYVAHLRVSALAP